MNQPETTITPDSACVVVRIDRTVISADALLKTCYWFSRDYVCDIRNQDEKLAEVSLTPRKQMSNSELESVKDSFSSSAIDFALREKIDAKTAGIRDLLLAKAFSESGILEDAPLGTFGDKIEEEKPRGMFNVLNNPYR